jgi:hypothetical protein
MLECWNIGMLYFLKPSFHHSTIPDFHRLSLSSFVRQRFFDDIANRIELFDPFGIQPKKFSPLNATCLVAYFFLRDILPQGVVESSGLLIGVEPSSLSFPRQQPVDGNFRGVGMRRSIGRSSKCRYTR